MQDGRPHGQMLRYNRVGDKTRVLSKLGEKTETSGWPFYIGETSDSTWNGQGKIFHDNGRVFHGEFIRNKMSKGVMSYLQEDGTRTTKQESYDAKSDSNLKIGCGN